MFLDARFCQSPHWIFDQELSSVVITNTTHRIDKVPRNRIQTKVRRRTTLQDWIAKDGIPIVVQDPVVHVDLGVNSTLILDLPEARRQAVETGPIDQPNPTSRLTLPIIHSSTIHPKAHQSTAYEYSARLTTSGERYSIVPTKLYARSTTNLFTP